MDKGLESDVNYIAYQKLVSDEKWFEDNKGKYIAIVDGVVAGVNENESELLNMIRSSYPDKQRYFKKIGDDEVIDMPSPLEIFD